MLVSALRVVWGTKCVCQSLEQPDVASALHTGPGPLGGNYVHVEVGGLLVSMSRELKTLHRGLGIVGTLRNALKVTGKKYLQTHTFGNLQCF